MTDLVFDIETGCESDGVLETLFTFDETKVENYSLLTKDFDPNEVKVGHMKDAAKIAAKIEESRQKFETAKANVTESIEVARAKAWDEFKDKAALSPLTGRVLAIGWINRETSTYDYEHISDNALAPMSEKELIETFLSMADAVLSDGGSLVGHNIIGFDLPFLLRRGLKHGIRPPKTITESLKQYRPANLIDTMLAWQFGSRTEKMVKLDALAAFFGCRRKTGDGKDFAQKFFGSLEERKEALRYMQNDVEMTAQIARKMQLID